MMWKQRKYYENFIYFSNAHWVHFFHVALQKMCAIHSTLKLLDIFSFCFCIALWNVDCRNIWKSLSKICQRDYVALQKYHYFWQANSFAVNLIIFVHPLKTEKTNSSVNIQSHANTVQNKCSKWFSSK